MTTQFLFLAYGPRSDIHKQTLAAIASLYASQKDQDSRPSVCLFTDSPKYYTWFEELKIETITTEKLTQWKGPANFNLRVKACILTEFVKSHKGPVIFLDSDTLIVEPLVRIEKALRDKNTVLQAREYRVSDRKTKERREFMHRLGNRNLCHGVSLGEDSWMWNSGLIGIPTEHLDSPSKVLDLIDLMIDQKLSSRTRLKEQLAFSLYFQQKTNLVSAGEEVLHYWGNKPAWMEWLDQWLLQISGRGLSPEAAGKILFQMENRPPLQSPKKTKSEKRKAKLRKLLRLD